MVKVSIKISPNELAGFGTEIFRKDKFSGYRIDTQNCPDGSKVVGLRYVSLPKKKIATLIYFSDRPGDYTRPVDKQPWKVLQRFLRRYCHEFGNKEMVADAQEALEYHLQTGPETVPQL